MIGIPIRRLVRRAGIDIEWRHTILFDLLERNHVDVVLDVGANEGQFGRRLRAWGYRGRIISFEPLRDAFTVLERHAARDRRWEVHRMAVGAENGTAELNVAGATVFSSLLPPDPALEAVFPTATVQRTETVEVRTLDSMFESLGIIGGRPFLKIDVQGFEHAVMQGAGRTLERVCGAQVELTLTRLYLGESTMGEIIADFERRGFVLSLIEPVAYNPASGALLSLDAAFFRSPVAANGIA